MKTGRVLIVEGDLILSGVLAARLEKTGCTVELRETGEKALKEIKKNRYDLFIISTNLRGEMDGFTLIKEIKNDPEISEIPILVNSSKPGIKKVLQELGINGFIEKPSDADILAKNAGKILDKKPKCNIDRI